MKRARCARRGWGDAQETVIAINDGDDVGLRVLFLLTTPDGEEDDDAAEARFRRMRDEAAELDARAELRLLQAHETRMDSVEGATRCPNPKCNRYTATYTLRNVRLGADEGASRVLECKACGYVRKCD